MITESIIRPDARQVGEKLKQLLPEALRTIEQQYPRAAVGLRIIVADDEPFTYRNVDKLMYMGSLGKLPWCIAFLKLTLEKGIGLDDGSFDLRLDDELLDTVLADLYGEYWDGKLGNRYFAEGIPAYNQLMQILDRVINPDNLFLRSEEITPDHRNSILELLRAELLNKDFGSLTPRALINFTLGPSSNLSLLLIKLLMQQQDINVPADYTQATVSEILQKQGITNPQIRVTGSQMAKADKIWNCASLTEISNIFEVICDGSLVELGIDSVQTMRNAMTNRIAEPDVELMAMINSGRILVDKVIEKSGTYYDAWAENQPILAAQNGWDDPEFVSSLGEHSKGVTSAHFCSLANLEIAGKHLIVEYTVGIPHAMTGNEEQDVAHGMKIKVAASQVIKQAVLAAFK